MNTLYTYYRSSAAYRVRIALNYKNIPYEMIPVHLLKNGGEQFSEKYRELNPQSLVPAFVSGDNIINQSIAIMEYLEEKFPQPNILPANLEERAHIRSFALMIACDIHPLQNRRVVKYLTENLHQPEDDIKTWIKHWIELGLTALEKILVKNNHEGNFCFGQTATMADMCLIPQMFAANRWGVDLDKYPILQKINLHCLKLEAFQKAHPQNQIDFE